MGLDSKKVFKQDLLATVLIIFCSVILTVLFLQLWKADLRVPFGYDDGDRLQFLTGFKNLQQTGRYCLWPRFGAPFGSASYENPIYGEALHIFEWLLLTRFMDFGLAFNVFYIALFPLTAVTTYWVLRKLNITIFASFMCGLCYTFLTYRFWRNQGHLPLSDYSAVPFTLLLAYWLVSDEQFLKPGKAMFRYRRNWYALIILIVSSILGMYYAFFTCFFLILAAGMKWLKNIKNWQVLLKGAACVAVIGITLLLASIPTRLYLAQNGTTSTPIERMFYEPELFGLKIANLLLPSNTHGIPILVKTELEYRQLSQVGYESSSYLGMVGVVGFLLMIVLLFVSLPKLFRKEDEAKVDLLKKLNLGALLLSLVGGFSVLFAIFVNPNIRGYGRISIFIAIFVFATVGLLLTNLQEKLGKRGRIVFFVLVAVVVMVNIREQVLLDPNDYTTSKENWESDGILMEQIESSLPENAMIYQLPYQPYPESPAVNGMGDYAHMRAYLHSETLRFSYGAFKGRSEDFWNKNISEMSFQDMIETLCYAEFEGLWLDSAAYLPEEFADMKFQVESILKASPIVSPNGRIYFYSLGGYAKTLRQNYSDEEWEALQASALQLPAIK